MRFLFVSSLLVLTAPLALAQPPEAPTTIAAPPQPVRGAPRPAEADKQIELDLKTFFEVLNNLKKDGILNNWEVASYLSDSRVGFFGGSEWTKYFAERRGNGKFRLDKVEFEKIEADSARVKVSYTLLLNLRVRRADGVPIPQPENQTFVETLDLKREQAPGGGGERWRIVAPAFGDIQPYNTYSLQNIAYFGRQQPDTVSKLRSVITANNLKQLSLGVLQFVQDYDEKYLFENAYWPEAIFPYVKNSSINTIPGTQSLYTFNDQLSDKNLAAINWVAATVLFYEGENQKPTYRYDGKAAIAYADGHVKLIAPDEEKALIWKP